MWNNMLVKTALIYLISLFVIFIPLYTQATTHKKQIDISLPSAWIPLKPILIGRISQQKPKMKLSLAEANSFGVFLDTLQPEPQELMRLQQTLPKTTLELLMSIQKRDVSLDEAQRMGSYLETVIADYKLQNITAFDENTSHIIGREWHEIDYSGENMTWQNQQKKYAPFGITNFKTLENLVKFFEVESKLPYFNKLYKPKSSQ